MTSSPDESLEARLNELEMRFMQQAEQLEALSSVIIAQGKEIDFLKREVSEARKRSAAEPGLVDPRDDSRPPHY